MAMAPGLLHRALRACNPSAQSSDLRGAGSGMAGVGVGTRGAGDAGSAQGVDVARCVPVGAGAGSCATESRREVGERSDTTMLLSDCVYLYSNFSHVSRLYSP